MTDLAPLTSPWRLLVGAAIVAACACSAPSASPREAATGVAGEQSAAVVINHVRPRRDFVGPLPERFEWTAAAGADRYALGLWDDVDRLRWRSDEITGTSVERPQDLDLEAGTYFWIVVGLRGGQQIADSGRAAFVVER
ncbi:MAG: hypothetical protein R2745_17765 [Vicinamibacterales bacterium]